MFSLCLLRVPYGFSPEMQHSNPPDPGAPASEDPIWFILSTESVEEAKNEQ